MTSRVLTRWTNTKTDAALTATFFATAEVLRKSSVRDTSGGSTLTYASVGEYPCTYTRFQIRPREVEVTARVQDQMYWDFHFLPHTDIRPTDKLTVGARTFEVVGVGDGSSDVVLSIIAVEIV